MRCWCSRRLASSRVTPSRTVTSLLAGSSARCTGVAASVAKRTSRLVRMPTSLPLPRSTTGMPEIWCRAISASASASVCSGWMVTGFTTMPDSNFLTLRTSAACASASRFLWMTPMPPACAMAIAMRRLGDGVHRRRHQRDAELDRAGEPGAGVGLVGQDRRSGGLQQDVVEGERLADGDGRRGRHGGLGAQVEERGAALYLRLSRRPSAPARRLGAGAATGAARGARAGPAPGRGAGPARGRGQRGRDRLGRVILALLTACIFVAANRLDPF